VAEARASRIAALAPLGSVLHLGAGDGQFLPALLATGAQQIILTEADPERAAELRVQAEGHQGVEVFDCAAAAADGRTTLRRMNLREASALRPPSGMSRLFPGLREIGTVEIDTRDATGLAELIHPQTERSNLLILDARGEEGAILARLLEGPALARFDHVLMMLPREQLYEGSATGTELTEMLASRDFTLVGRDDSDPDLPEAQFHRPIALPRSRAREQKQAQRNADLERRLKAQQAQASQIAEPVRAETRRLAAQLDLLHQLLSEDIAS
jgi:FkbM family methyltransferase